MQAVLTAVYSDQFQGYNVLLYIVPLRASEGAQIEPQCGEENYARMASEMRKI